MKHFFITVTLFSTILFASNITIAVAANVSYAIKPLVKAFNQSHIDTKVNVILGSSGKLLAQITHGAPYDIFLSANIKYPQHLYNANLTLNKPIVYAQGALAILSKKPRNLSGGLRLFLDNSIKKIAIANPKTAPYGVATKEALEHLKLYKLVEDKFIYGESISQTLLYAISATDLGVVAKSLLFSPKMSQYKEGKNWVDVDISLYTPIDQAMVILKSSKSKLEAKAFYDFMLSSSAKKILISYGYRVP